MNRLLDSFEEALSRNKLSHFVDQGFDLKGIVQGGANDGEELENAIRLGVEYYIAFEPLPSAFEKLIAIPMPTTYYCEQLGLDNYDGVGTLSYTFGDGKGSSLLETVWDHPEVVKNWNQGQTAVEGDIEVPILKFSTWAKDNPQIDLSLFDTLQLDTQGNEMEILEGMGDLLQGFKYLCIEISEVPVYVGETPGAQLSDWLDAKGFLRDSPITAHNDTFFIRKDIKSETDGLYKGRC